MSAESPIFKNPLEKEGWERESIRPISFRVEDEIGVFSAQEDKKGNFVLKIENRAGDEITLNDMLPTGWVVGGNIKAAGGRRFMGELYPADSSADFNYSQIIVSESQMRGEGWPYILTFLHELGHAMIHEENPDSTAEMNKALNDRGRHPGDIEAYKKESGLVAQNERDAWAFAIREFKKLARTLNLPKEKIFPNAEALKIYVYQKSLKVKVEWERERIIDKFDLGEEERQRLAEEISHMYTKTEKGSEHKEESQPQGS